MYINIATYQTSNKQSNKYLYVDKLNYCFIVLLSYCGIGYNSAVISQTVYSEGRVG